MGSNGKVQFSSKLGLIAATVGSAVGLGNIWRFPAVAQQGGGAAFLIAYVVCVLLLGIPVMLAEFALGRAGGTDAIGSFGRVSPRHKGWAVFGALAVLTAFLIAVFYSVVTGWTMEYLVESVSGGLYAPEGGLTAGPELFKLKMSNYVASDLRPVIFTSIVVILNICVLLGGVTKGIERLSNILMPMLFVLLLIFVGVALTLPKAGEGLEFFFKPDFSKLTAETLLSALGQAFFSLSLGMGILMTYAAYYPPSTRLTRTASTVSILDMLVAVMMGVIIFPAVMSFNLQDHGIAGTTLAFVTLPEVFARMPLSQLWSALFFLLLTIAALTSTVSIIEVTIKCLQDRLKMSRRAACWLLCVPLLVLSIVCSLSLGPLSHYRLLGRNMFDFLDFVTAEFMLPIAAIGTCLFVGWVAPKGLLRKQLTNNGKLHSWISGAALFIIRYLAPVLIALVLISPLL